MALLARYRVSGARVCGLLLTTYCLLGQFGVDGLFLLLFVLYDEYLSAFMVASGIRLSNLLLLEGSGISQGHQPVLASSLLRGGEVETCFISVIARMFGNTSTHMDYMIDQFCAWSGFWVG